jgi:hypothetical protein
MARLRTHLIDQYSVAVVSCCHFCAVAIGDAAAAGLGVVAAAVAAVVAM